MPYIKPERRAELDGISGIPHDVGELTYALSVPIKKFLTQQPKKYVTYAAVIAALEDLKLEFYARVVRPYEDQKIAENGDGVFDDR